MDDETGLSSKNRSLIVFLTFFLLLIFGPVDPPSLIIRIAYLVLVPLALSYLLKRFSEIFIIEPVTNDRINRMIYSAVAGMMLVGAYQSYTADYHYECDQYGATEDDGQCIGDSVRAGGGDFNRAWFYMIVALGAIWMAVSKAPDEKN